MGRSYEIPAFSKHLISSSARDCVLKREGSARRYTYRFRKPLLQPCVVLAAVADGLIPDRYKIEIYSRADSGAQGQLL